MEYISFEHDSRAEQLIGQAYDTPPLAFVHSYGCQQNVNDGERIKGVLVDIGYGLCDKPEDADLILFNTCAVREHAEQRVFGNVGALKGLKEKKPGLIIGLCGCMANQAHVVEKLRKSYPYVDLVFGVDGIDTLPQLICRKLEQHKRVLLEPAQRPVIVEHLPIRRESEFRAWLPIMYGCDNFCTYCIVPYVRGREKSRRPADILAEFRGLVEAGYKEITLLGQNVNSYGKGLEEPIDFSDLLNLLCAVPGDYHIRFMTSHPKDASRKLIDTIAAQPRLCKHLHLPVQCGSDRILAQMNRHYTVEQYLDLIEYARRTVPGITFSSDIIVGFPGETEEDFQGTLELIRKVGYMQLFTFIYSRREGTKAALLPDPTPRREKTDRMERLLKTQDAIAMELVKAQVGRTVRVLVEGHGRLEGQLSGRLDNNLTVEFAADPPLLGQYAYVRLTGARATVLLGECVPAPEGTL
ncbi:MAG: tRNA (N6-isopentenyl adenosine(37)-C2)-methylthiotransferase MiaB [Candidatus Faecalibacterium intestinavium]|uniref:tRNA-2-methylthio-N(6)-dimethylallyladenosine synthase n=1 Tax=Candidatus Faecalibacterium intestinavium TaxID=2838580 RepID=A0A9E2KIE4_9FIRM|nr:tRNA (N6-isopentenyl adenosine(37)-C2)-methylthiotransferase MiaB [Candidatus Faecalibacterium intestinavium]